MKTHTIPRFFSLIISVFLLSDSYALAETSVSVGSAFDKFINGAAEVNINTPLPLMNVLVDNQVVGTSDSKGAISLTMPVGAHAVRVENLVRENNSEHFLDIQYYEVDFTLAPSQVFDLSIGSNDLEIKATREGNSERAKRQADAELSAERLEASVKSERRAAFIESIKSKSDEMVRLSDEFAKDVALVVGRRLPQILLDSIKVNYKSVGEWAARMSGSETCSQPDRVDEFLQRKGWVHGGLYGDSIEDEIDLILSKYANNINSIIDEIPDAVREFNHGNRDLDPVDIGDLDLPPTIYQFFRYSSSKADMRPFGFKIYEARYEGGYKDVFESDEVQGVFRGWAQVYLSKEADFRDIFALGLEGVRQVSIASVENRITVRCEVYYTAEQILINDERVTP